MDTIPRLQTSTNGRQATKPDMRTRNRGERGLLLSEPIQKFVKQRPAAAIFSGVALGVFIGWLWGKLP